MREKEELELILNTHRFHCGSETVGSLSSGPVFNSVQFNNARVETPSPSKTAAAVNAVSEATREPLVNTVTSGSSGPALNAQVPVTIFMTSGNGNNAACRPNSFPTAPLLRPMTMVATSAGPNVVTFGLESMLDGHTGLTPITGIPSGAIAVANHQLHPPTSGGNLNSTGASGLTAL